jgi:hypothetical protein
LSPTPRQKVGFGALAERLGDLKVAAGTRPARMHDPPAYPLMIKMGDLFPQNESSSKVGPRGAALSEFWLSAMTTP